MSGPNPTVTLTTTAPTLTLTLTLTSSIRMGEEDHKAELQKLGVKQQARCMPACAHTRTRTRTRTHTRPRPRPHAYIYIQVFLDGQRRQIEQRHEMHRFLMSEREAEKKNCVERTAACHDLPCPPDQAHTRHLITSVRRSWPGTHLRLEVPSGCLGHGGRSA